MPHMPDFEAWAIFGKVAERGSFSQAAEDLGIAKTVVSKAISRLEERMRTTLLHRTTRKLSLTESGRLALERATRIFADASTIETDILDEAAVPRGMVRVAVSTAFGTKALAPVLPNFLSAYPDVSLDLCLTDNRIDLIADGFDVALQIGPAPDSSLRISRLFSLRRPLVASPGFVERHGRPEHPSELERFPAIIPTHVLWGQNWEFHRPGHESCTVHMNGSLHLNNASAMVPALVAGIGLSTFPEYYIWPELNDGRLIELLPEWNTPPGTMFVVTPPGRARPARVRVLLEFLRQQFASQPWAHGVETW